MPGPKTNEREGVRAVLRHARVSAFKVRPVLDLIRNQPVMMAEDILRFCERDPAILVGKVLHSAVANAGPPNGDLDPEELYVSACYADEGTTVKRWRPRARGRATRIRKRTCHVTVIVTRLAGEDLVRVRARQEAEMAARRGRRVSASRGADAPAAGGRLRRRRGAAAQGEAPPAEDEVVDQQAEALEAVDQAEPDTAEAVEAPVTEAEEEGIVDQQAAAVEVAEEPAEEADASPSSGERSEQEEGE